MNSYKRFFSLLILFLCLSYAYAGAQVMAGVGFSGLKYLGSASARPMAAGVTANLGVDISHKAMLIVAPTLYFPVTYTHNETFNVNNVPTFTRSNERFNIFETSLLLQYDIIGDNSTSFLYVAFGPGVAMYNARITRENIEGYNYSQNFNDLLLDARAGVCLPLGVVQPFAEIGIAPVIATSMANRTDYTPNRSTYMSGTIGLRFKL